jgi:signal transduction histidine kinase/CheY-like chemotaxis protein
LRLIRCLAILCLASGAIATAQTKITLQQAGSRVAPDFVPKYEGEEVLVSGQVSAPPIWIADSSYLAIQDADAYGLLLQGTMAQFRGLVPGDWVEAQGLLARRGGRPTLLPRDVRRIGHENPPAPKVLKPGELASFRYLGVLVTTDGIVSDQDENGGGDLLSIGDKTKDLSVFLPRIRRDTGPQLNGFRSGDRIRVTGIASQYCTLPPYDRYFQIMVPSPAAVTLLERGWVIQPPVLLASLILAAALALIWWFRENRMGALRKQMRLLNALGEEVISASSPVEVLRRLTSTLPALSNGASVGLFILNRATKTLEGVHSVPAAERIDPEAPHGALPAAVAACFRKRSLISIPDTRRSSGFRHDGGVAAPRSILLVPMLAQTELMGVLELHHSERVHYFSAVEQAAMQHLANQVAMALKLQEQQAVREQLFRSEKLAAAGQLISDVANELRSPLEAIASLVSSVQSDQGDRSNRELESIAQEARRAADIASRLVSFAKVEQSQVETVDLNALLSGLLKFRAPEWKAKGIETKSHLAGTPAEVLASPAQLEQVFLNLLVEAEKSASESQEKIIAVSSSLLAGRVLVEISYGARSPESQKPDPSDNNHAAAGTLGLGVSRGIIQSYGGEFREARRSPSQVRFDVELPMTEPAAAGFLEVSEAKEAGRQLTILVVEPDTKIQRQLLQLLGARGNRVVPVSSAEEGADVAERLRFDVVICAIRLPGLNWVEFFERVRYRVGGFVLLTDGYDQGLGRAFKNGEGFVLSKPIDEGELLRICRTIEERAAVHR